MVAGSPKPGLPLFFPLHMVTLSSAAPSRKFSLWCFSTEVLLAFWQDSVTAPIIVGYYFWLHHQFLVTLSSFPSHCENPKYHHAFPHTLCSKPEFPASWVTCDSSPAPWTASYDFSAAQHPSPLLLLTEGSYSASRQAPADNNTPCLQARPMAHAPDPIPLSMLTIPSPFLGLLVFVMILQQHS